jgi:hypothetical protein
MLLGTSTNVRTVVSVVFIALILVGAVVPLYAQSTVATGNIQGTITDTTGGVVAAAKVTITNTDTGQTLNLATSSSGVYNSGSLVPGNYSVRAQAQGFKTVEQRVVVRVGVVSGVNLTLEVGAANAVVEVNEQAVSVNTEQASVQGVLNKDQIENLPVNGRNFLDLAQLEPGVQIQDGSDFDPTKVGFSSISVGGRFGRTARIEVDGVDVSDETVGTTTENIPASAIDEFQISQSERELSFEPSVSLYNLFNFANFNIPGNVLSGILTGGAGSLNGTTYADANSVRVGVGTGVFALGAPRTIEFGLKLTF